MSLNWIKITERAREGITIINTINYEVFETVLDYVYKNMNPENESDEPENALEQLEKFVGIRRNDFLLLIKTLSYILKRISTIIIKPTKLQEQLRDKLKIADDKIDGIIKIYIKNTKIILDNLNSNTQLIQLGWNLKMQLASNCQQKERNLLAHLQLKTNNNNNNNNNNLNNIINLEMNHNELLDFYNQIEIIQNELDSIRSK